MKHPINVQRIEIRSQVRAFHALSRGAAGSQSVKHRYRMNEDNSPALPNLLNRQFNPAAPNRIWCGDISFIRLQDKCCYLALVVDLYSRRIIGSALSLTADADLVYRALRNALETRLRNGRVLFHSDQGVQYKINTEGYSDIME